MISKATEKDVNQIMRNIQDVVQEMGRIQNFQWDNTYPTRSVFSADIKENNLFVYKNSADTVVGLICANSYQPKEYRNITWQENGEVLVLHRMAVDVNSRGKGIARALIKFAENIAFERNIKVIRSDTYSTNTAMNALFLNHGYNFAGEIKFMNKPLPFNCYNKVLG